jgi:hypothetical protein
MHDPFDPANLQLSPEQLETITATKCVGTPIKIQKRRKNFIMFPMWWYEKLQTCKSAKTVLLAVYLLHLDWKHKAKPFTLANGMLEYDGISRQSKWRALRTLERLGLIVVECRNNKSPVIYIQLDQPLHL